MAPTPSDAAVAPAGRAPEGGAARGGDASAIDGSAVSVSADGAPPDTGVAMPVGALGDVPVGTAPSFDPAAVYVIGPRNDHFVRPAPTTPPSIPSPFPVWNSIAPLDDLFDNIEVLPLGLRAAHILPANGRLHYQATPPLNLPEGYTGPPDVLRELTRDAPPPLPTAPVSPPLPETEADPIVEDAAPCEVHTGGGVGRLFVPGWDGTTYHACDHDSVDEAVAYTLHGPFYESYAWYDDTGSLVYQGDVWLRRVGPMRRALGQRWASGTWEIVVLDLDGGTLLAQIDPLSDFEPGDELEMTSVRMRADGFWLALQLAPTTPGAGTRLVWLDVSLDGEVLGRGDYAPLPDGLVTRQLGRLMGHRIAIDARGSAYQTAYAEPGPGHVIVERPMHGDSVVRHIQTTEPEAIDIADAWTLLVSGG